MKATIKNIPMPSKRRQLLNKKSFKYAARSDFFWSALFSNCCILAGVYPNLLATSSKVIEPFL